MIAGRSTILASGLVVLVLACNGDRDEPSLPPPEHAAVTAAAPAPVLDLSTRYRGVGRPPTTAEVARWNIDANDEGAGLPSGRGTYQRGAELFASRCAACHGQRGEGLPPFPRLIGAEPRDSFPFGHDPRLVKTIGNYWPYATTVYDYVNRAMPFNAPGSLTPDETYSIVAFLLAENGIISRETVVDARSLPRVRMPAHDRFVRDNRTGGPIVR